MLENVATLFRSQTSEISRAKTTQSFKYCILNGHERLEDNLMKTVYKFLTLGAMMAAFVFANATSSFAQGTEKDQMYEKFIGCYKATDAAAKDACFAGAKEFLDKFESQNDEYTKFVRKQYDKYVQGKIDAEKAKVNQSFNEALKNPQAVNSDVAFASGKQILAGSPDLIDVPIALASVGFDNASAKTPNDKYNADTINYAKMAIQMIEAGKPSVTGDYGVFSYSYKTKEFPDGKNNALGWMNYAIGYIMYNRMNQKKEALPYFFKAAQYNSGTKTYPELYRIVGSWYLDEFLSLDKKRLDIIKAAGDKDTDESLQILALQKGYADRALEAYARAYKVAPSDAASQAYKTSLLNRTKELYGIRYNNDMSGFDAYIAKATDKPLTDPTTAVTPIVEATPATTGATPSGATTMTNTATTPTPTTTRPTNTTASTTKAATTTTNGTTTTTPTTTKTPAKKPAPKKKGTR
jgi:hypothetical protein